MKRNKIKCKKCELEISKSNYSRHLNSCNGLKKEKLTKCPYCNKELHNTKPNENHNHIKWCNKNPNRINYINDLSIARESIINKGWNRGLTKETDKRVKKSGETLSKNIKNGITVSSFKNKHHREESKRNISLKLKQSHKNGSHPGWKHINTDEHRRSYPEKWFIENIINQHGLNKIFEIKEKMPFGKYFLDFAFLNIKLDVEIDGQQHNRSLESIDHDKKRDEYLKEHGWLVFRIKWINMKEDITRFLYFIESLKENDEKDNN
jgi:very-short-patch-repair endonuclease